VDGGPHLGLLPPKCYTPHLPRCLVTGWAWPMLARGGHVSGCLSSCVSLLVTCSRSQSCHKNSHAPHPNAQVDATFAGHVHTYYRTCPVRRQECRRGGITHFVVCMDGVV
jgi:hypothetical protein